jgi:hypothetical protein
MITNLKDLFKSVCDNGTGTVEEMQDDIRSRIYKDYTCGPWISFDDGGVTLGSIVEGSNACAEEHKLNYPFGTDDFDDALDNIDAEVAYLWSMERHKE